MHGCVLSRVQLFVTAWTTAPQAPLSMEFSREEYGRALPFPTPGDLPDPGIEPAAPALAGGFFTAEQNFYESFTPCFAGKGDF